MSIIELINTKLDFSKNNGLIPAIVLDEKRSIPLMLGYMNREALEETIKRKKVVFFSRTKNRLWLKGEKSGNYLHLVNISADCDFDTLLITVNPAGPVCHTGNDNCFNIVPGKLQFLKHLETIIHSRKIADIDQSYTSFLLNKGANYIGEKINEEAMELTQELNLNARDRFIEEAGDLIYHLMVACSLMNVSFEDISGLLEQRHLNSKKSKLEV